MSEVATTKQSEVTTTKKTVIVFSGEMDKILAAFVIANGAAAMGDDVTMFFTFWGLNVLRKDKNAHVHKTPLERAFGWMMPRGTDHLRMSHFNFAGAGPHLMGHMMKAHNVDPISAMLATAKEQGIKMIACTMSMDVMGIHREELIEDLEYAGVATYLGEADEANVNLFI